MDFPTSSSDPQVPKVLFVSHEASRTGAVIALLRQVTWLAEQGVIRPVFLVRTPGELFDRDILEAFEALGPTRLVSARIERIRRIVTNRLAGWPSRWLDLLFCVRCWAAYRDVDVVWFNTVMNGPAHFDLSLLAAPRVCHIHELSRFLRAYLPPEWMSAAIDDVDVWAAVSDPVAEMLNSRYRVDPGRMEILPGIANLAAPPSDRVSEPGLRESQPGLRESQPDDSAVAEPDQSKFRVAAIGPPVSRKGSDIFVAVAVELARRGWRERVEMTWLGGKEGTSDFDDLLSDVQAAGLAGMVSVLPARKDLEVFYADLDLLLIPSRQESFPLVMLEAGAFGVPIVTFAASGGSAVFASWGAGVTVPYLDSRAMAEAVISLMGNPEELRRLGAASRALVERRFTSDAIGASCESILGRVLASPRRRLRARLRRVLASRRPS
jgi:glycosyltransferase involved in cell wall biosynthesis